MKSFFVWVVLFSVSICRADISTTNVVGDITTRVTERAAADGRPDLRIETVYRGKAKVLQTISRRDKQGKLAVISRSYIVNGQLHMVESDHDGDGYLESVTVFDPGTANFEAFKRQPTVQSGRYLLKSFKPSRTRRPWQTKR